jgi:hypothetical protein
MKEQPVNEPTGRDIGLYLRIHPQAPVYVQIGRDLIPIRDIYYDNERGANIIILEGGELWDERPTHD